MSVESSRSSTEVLFARVEPELKQELVELAREHDRSLSGEMRVLLRGQIMVAVGAERTPRCGPRVVSALAQALETA